jgi:hypothetical protein
MLSQQGHYGPPAHKENDNKYNTWYYGRRVSGDSYAWCVVFACFAMDHFGILKANGGKFAYVPNFKAHFSAVGSYKGKPKSVSVLKPGDPIAYDFNRTGEPEHFGTFYKKVSATTFKAIEGNTGNDEVAIRTRSIHDVEWYAELQGVSGDTTSGVHDDMPTYVSVDKVTAGKGASRIEELKSGEWHQVYWNKNNSGGADQHHGKAGDYPSLVNGPAYYNGTINITIDGLTPGIDGQIRALYVDAKSSKALAHCSIGEFKGTDGRTHVEKSITGYVPKGAKLRVELVHFGPTVLVPKVVAGEARIQVWEA